MRGKHSLRDIRPRGMPIVIVPDLGMPGGTRPADRRTAVITGDTTKVVSIRVRVSESPLIRTRGRGVRTLRTYRC